MNLYDYAIFKVEKRNADGDITDPGAVLAGPITVLARDENEARTLAARAIPETEITNLDRIKVEVRPF